MRGIRGPAIAVAACGALLLGAGCGSDEEPERPAEAPEVETTTPTEPVEPTEPAEVETADEPAKLPEGWSRVIDREAGFSIGLPPGWRSGRLEGAAGSELRSPDGLIAISVLADRSAGALRLPLDEFAERTAEALGSEIADSERFRGLEVFGVAPFKHRYDAAAARAVGTPAGSGVRERVLVVVARRPGMASYVVVVRENFAEASQFGDRDTVKRVIRSLRGRPPS